MAMRTSANRRRAALVALFCGLFATAVVVTGFAQITAGQETLRNTTESRDWQKYPAIVQLQTTTDIVAVGDVHGDYKNVSSNVFLACQST
jgi:hypothetical protein